MSLHYFTALITGALLPIVFCNIEPDGLTCVDPRDFGAIEGNADDGCGTNWLSNTHAIQFAIDTASAHAIFGCVQISGGDYISADLTLRSNMVFRIDEGSRLFSAVNHTSKALLLLRGVKNVLVVGPGTVHGNAEHYISYYDAVDDRFEPTFADGLRPRLVLMEASEDVVVRNIRLQNASDWHLHALGCRNVSIDFVHITGDWRYPNNDGIDPESCIDFSITNSEINVADDGVCLKSVKGYGPLRNLLVRNVTIRSKSHAIKFGTNCDTDMSNILFENITIWDSNSGIGIQQRSQGSIHNVTFRHIHIETRHVSPRWWGNGEWLTVTAEPRRDGDTIGEVYDLTLEHIHAVSENGGLVSGRDHGVRGFVMRNVTVVMDRWSNYSTGKSPRCQQNGDNAGSGGNEINCTGTRDYRPSLLDHNCSHYCRTAALADGIYLENVHDASIANVTVRFMKTRHVPYWGECLVADSRSTGVMATDIVCIR